MVTREQNDRLTRVGPGTPCGELMRRYWIPIRPYAQLLENPVQKVRILGEDLVLYKDKSGKLGLIGDRCLHRKVDLQYGIPDECGLRCPYHGWLFNETGNCVERPMEGAPQAQIKQKLKGHKPIVAAAPERGNVVNLMDALKESLSQSKPSAKSKSKAEPAAKTAEKAATGKPARKKA